MPRAAMTMGPDRLELREIDPVSMGPRDVRVAVEATGLCGTDLHLFDGSLEGGAYPMIQGHEFCGRIIEHGGDVDPGLERGERVVVDPVVSCGDCYPCATGAANACTNMEAIGVHRPGGLQEQVVVPADRVHPVGDLAPTVAALCEPMSIAQHAIVRGQVEEGQQVIVLGAGPIGLGCTLAARRAGARVLTVDVHRSRLELAESMGAERVALAGDDLRSTVRDWTAGHGPAVAIEAAGVASVAEDAFHLVAASGSVVLVGVSHQQARIDLRLFTRKELTVVGTRATRDFPAAVQLVREEADLLATLVTHRFPLEHVGEAFRIALERPEETVKVVVTAT